MAVRPHKHLPKRRPRARIRDGRGANITSSPAMPLRVPAAAQPALLLRTSKGTRPGFFDDPAIDQLFAIVTALAGEVSVAFDRIDTLEQVLGRQGTLQPQSLESYRPSPDVIDARMRKREELLQRVFAVFESAGSRRAR